MTPVHENGTTDDAIEAWAVDGIVKGYAVRSGHLAYDGRTFVSTLVLQHERVKALHSDGLLGAADDLVNVEPTREGK